MKPRAIVPRLIIAGGVGAGAVWLVLHREYFDAAALAGRLAALGGWAPAAFVLLYAAGTVLFAPGSAFSVAGGALFGPVWGTVYNLAGATLGAALAFIAARYLARDWVARKAGPALNRIMRGVEEEGWRFVAFVRLVPLFPFNLVNYALGLTRIALVEYAAATAVCIVPGALAYTYLGYAGRQAVGGGGAGAVRSAVIALSLLGAVALLPRLMRRLRAQPGFIEAAELKRRLEDGALHTVVIDVRGIDEFDGPLGHIPGARNVVLGELPARLDALAELKDVPLVLVCKTDKRSAKAAQLMREAGFRDVAVLRAGMESWNSAGLPVERRPS